MDIKGIRVSLGVTQEKMAIVLGTTKVTVARYEGGKISPTGIIRNKLQLLVSSISSDKEYILSILKLPHGYETLAAMLSFATAICTSEDASKPIRYIIAGKGGDSLINAVMISRGDVCS